MSEWQEVVLTDIYEISSGLSKPADSFGSGYPFLSFKDVFNNYFVPDELSQLVESSEDERLKGSIKRGDVFLTRTSETMHELGMSSVALKDYPDATFNGFTKRLRPKEDAPFEVYPEFIAYYLRSPKFRQGMLAFSTMSTRASLNNSMIGTLKIKLPPIETQKSIARVLKYLDDKIKLNRQINQTLEQIAQAIFKSWFVDFEPVKAKIEAKQNGQDPERAAMRAISGKTDEELDQLSPEQHQQLTTTAALFPGELEDSELGVTPKGWVVKTLDKKLTPKKGKNITKKTITPGFVPVVAGGLTPAYYHNAHNVTGPVITISASGANAGFVNLYHQNVWASDCSFINDDASNYVYSVYLFLKGRQDEITKMQQGAAQPHVYPKDLARLVLTDAPDEIWRKIENIVGPFFESMKIRIDEITSLAELRDSLLPKLLSGEIEVEAA